MGDAVSNYLRHSQSRVYSCYIEVQMQQQHLDTATAYPSMWASIDAPRNIAYAQPLDNTL